MDGFYPNEVRSLKEGKIDLALIGFRPLVRSHDQCDLYDDDSGDDDDDASWDHEDGHDKNL
jgi:hypothetical protein